MKAAYVGSVVIVLLAGALPAFAQDDETPPVIDNITFERQPNLGVDPLFGPWGPAVPFDPNTDIALEGDLIILTVEVSDAGLPEDELFMRKQSEWWPYDYNTPAPEPPPVDGDTPTFRAPPNLVVGVGTATFVVEFVIPEWLGPNQARLRGEIDWDVRWIVTIEVCNEEDPDPQQTPIAEESFVLLAVENPAFRPSNPPPFADAGPDMTVAAGTTVILDASRTFDASNMGFDVEDQNVFEKDTLTYAWEWVDGPVQVDPVQEQATDPIATVTLSGLGIYTYRVTVSDNANPGASSASVHIEVVAEIPANNAPTAVISGPTAAVTIGEVITLDGSSSSDPDNDTLTYLWRQTDELGGILPPEELNRVFLPISGRESAVSTWQAVQAGTFYVRLLVGDGQLSDISSIFSIDVVEPETAGVTGGGVGGTGDPGQTPPGVLPCGPGVAGLALVPLLLWPMRGRIR